MYRLPVSKMLQRCSYLFFYVIMLSLRINQHVLNKAEQLLYKILEILRPLSYSQFVVYNIFVIFRHLNLYFAILGHKCFHIFKAIMSSTTQHQLLVNMTVRGIFRIRLRNSIYAACKRFLMCSSIPLDNGKLIMSE